MSAELLGFKLRPWRNYVHELRRSTLQPGKQLGIETQLQNCAAPRLACKFGVDNLVVPVTKPAWTGDAPENVGASYPASIGESALHDDVSAGAHCPQRLVELRRIDADAADLNDLMTGLLKMLDVSSFMSGAAGAQNLQMRVPFAGGRQFASGDGQIRFGQIPAAQVSDEVRCAELCDIIDDPHGGDRMTASVSASS
jgi:hypothetical protein